MNVDCSTECVLLMQVHYLIKSGVRANSRHGADIASCSASNQLSESVIRAVVRHHLALTVNSLGYGYGGGSKKTVLIS